MSKELREMLDSINTMKDEVKGLYAENKNDEAEAKMNELEALQVKFDNLLKLEDDTIVPEAKPVDDRTDMDRFVDSMRMKFRDQMSEGTPAAGGYTVPSDIQTQVNQYKKALVALEDLITVEKVSEPTGSRVYQTKAQAPAFATAEEAAAIGAGTDPQFEQITYACEKRGAIFTVTDELLADSDANIEALLAQWIAEGDVRTTNAQVLAALNTLTATAITDPGQLRLSCGAISLPIFVVPDAQLANPASGSYPFFVGDFKEFMRKYDLQKYTIKTTDVGTVNSVSAFENDLTYFRVTERNDFVKIDADAAVKLTLTPQA